MTKDKQLRGIKMPDVMEKRRLGQALNIKEFAVLAGVSYSIARYWNNTVIKDCLINSSCNGIRLIGPATRLIIANNLFRGPGEEPHRTSGEKRRTNMLSGIILQPGEWDATTGPLDDVFIANNVMEHVASPVTLWTKPGNPAGKDELQGHPFLAGLVTS